MAFDPGACVYCGERRCCHDLAAATAAKAALEAQLRDERAAHEATRRQLQEAKRYDGAVAETIRGVMPSIEAERDALAAQLKVVREMLRIGLSLAHFSCKGSDGGGEHWPDCWVSRARAALAASGPVKEGT